MKKLGLIIVTAGLAAALSGCGKANIDYMYLETGECAQTLGANNGYFSGLNQKCLSYYDQWEEATTEDYIQYSQESATDFTDEDKEVLDEVFEMIEESFDEQGLKWPAACPVKVGATTMDEVPWEGGYTLGTTMFLSEPLIASYAEDEDADLTELEEMAAHQLFHTITRNRPEIRKDLYELMGFSVAKIEFEIPEDIYELMIMKPDVNYRDSYATFTIDGQPKECLLLTVCRDDFQKEGDTPLDTMFTCLLDINDGTPYVSDDASDFYEIMGNDGIYFEDPEEALAYDFADAIVHGQEGDNSLYVQGILDYFKK